MKEEHYDVVVVGAGVVGSFTAYHLAKQGFHTLLLEQFYLPHSRGSSSSQTRLIRNFCVQDYYYEMMPEAFSMWHRLETDTGKSLFRKTSVLQADGKKTRLESTSKVMKRHNMPHKLLSSQELREFYPTFTFADDQQGLLDQDAGILFASKCIATLQEQFCHFGGVIRDGEEVREVKQLGKSTFVATPRTRYFADKIVLCPGPWSPEILTKLGLKPPLKTMVGHQFYFKATTPSMHTDIPIVLHDLTLKEGYQFVISKPINEYPGLVKVATRGEPFLKYRHPNERDCDSDEVKQFIIQYVKNHMPYLDPNPCIVDPCVYTMTPDKDFIIDVHPQMSNIIIGCGFSGHGFKLAPIIGKLLAELVQDKPTSYDISHFKITRFNTVLGARL